MRDRVAPTARATKNYVTPNGTMVLEVAKALYGLVESAWLWYQELADSLCRKWGTRSLNQNTASSSRRLNKEARLLLLLIPCQFI